MIVSFGVGVGVGYFMGNYHKMYAHEKSKELANDSMARVVHCKVRYITSIGPTKSLDGLLDQEEVEKYKEQTAMLADALCKDMYWNGGLWSPGWWNEGYVSKIK